jgi:hypothetical protein
MDQRWKEYNAELVDLIQKLGDKDTSVREPAHKKLLKVGPRALHQFRFSGLQNDPVWRRSVFDLFDAIQKQYGIQSNLENGVEFLPFADSVWKIPPARRQSSVKFGVKLTNLRDTRVCFCLFDFVQPFLVGPDGQPVKRYGGRDHVVVHNYWSPTLGTGETYSVDSFQANLRTSAGGKTCLEGETKSGWSFGFDDLKPGTYYLWFGCVYESETAQTNHDGVPVWTGNIPTPFLSFRISN